MYSKGFSLIDFIDQFHAEEDCQDYLFLIKHGDFPYCQKCESKRVNKISTRGYGYYCLSCSHQFSVIKGTLFENTKIPLRKWFLAIYLMTIDKRGISALELSRKINTTHRTAMVMLKNLRKLMVDNDGEFILEDVVEIDEFFIGASEGKAGRDTDKAKILISLPFDLPKSKNSESDNNYELDIEDERYAMYLKMLHVDNLNRVC